MSEEEKQAIELLKQEPDYSLSYYKREKAIDIVLNLINKQQKEIEELNEIKQQICNEELITQDYVQENFISKDKIREKIKKEEKYQETTKKLFPDSLNYHIQKYGVEILKELLEE